MFQHLADARYQSLSYAGMLVTIQSSKSIDLSLLRQRCIYAVTADHLLFCAGVKMVNGSAAQYKGESLRRKLADL